MELKRRKSDPARNSVRVGSGKHATDNHPNRLSWLLRDTSYLIFREL